MSAEAKILITGSEGLIGSATRSRLEQAGCRVAGCDIRASDASERFDFRNVSKLRRALSECDGVIHLAAVSRVVWGERFPAVCRDINVNGMRLLTQTLLEMKRKVWLIFASSREVYGAPETLPCAADAPFNPANVYAGTKVAGEQIAHDFRARGGRMLIIRFSNVFGSTGDYPDRVVPAFTKAAANKGVLRLRGGDGVYDFTPLADAVNAVLCAARQMRGAAGDLPPVNIVTGRPASLREIADMALQHGGGEIVTEPAVPYYPSKFYGDPEPARRLLGWAPEEILENAIEKLVKAFQSEGRKRDENPQNHSWLSAAL